MRVRIKPCLYGIWDCPLIVLASGMQFSHNTREIHPAYRDLSDLKPSFSVFNPILSALLNERPQSSFILIGAQEDVVNTGSLSSWHVYTKLEHYSTFLFVSIDSRNLPVSQGIGRI